MIQSFNIQFLHEISQLLNCFVQYDQVHSNYKLRDVIEFTNLLGWVRSAENCHYKQHDVIKYSIPFARDKKTQQNCSH